MKHSILIITMAVLLASAVSAQSKRPAIIESIESGSKVKVEQDPKLDKLLNDYIGRQDDASAEHYTGTGYRVQVFSSNAQRTAKDESLNVERRLRIAFPEHGIYRTYSSPFWKVRIGDFRTQAEAQSFRELLIKTFPDMKKETYTVFERKITIR